MNAFFGLLIACLAVVSHAVDLQIVNGTDAEVGAHPYMVSLRKQNKHFCGGSIISENYILTAAHCLMQFKKPSDLDDVTVHAGTNLLSKSGTVYKPEESIIHPNFNLLLIRNDVGLLRLNTNIEYNKLVQPISVAKTNSVLEGDPCFLTGWGTLEFLGKVPDRLQKLDLKVYSQIKCKASFWNVRRSHICAFSKNGQGACHGDSGSPLVANGIQIGLASFVRPCAVGHPDVYTRVSSFISWINQYTVQPTTVIIAMNTIAGLIIACLALAIHGLPDPQIVGGYPAPKGQYPYQVSLRTSVLNPNSHFCGGAIINKRYVITTAKCVITYNRNPYRVFVVVGSNELNATDSSIYQAMNLITHAGFNKLLRIHDIALIKVQKDIEFNDNVQSISLPTADRNFDDYPLVATGWGRLGLTRPVPNDLQEIILKGYSHELCSQYPHVRKTHICTFTKKGKGTCYGDGGGPLVADGILVGLMSFSYGVCGTGAPDVSTRVYSYLSWIKLYTKDLSL
ncbi:transmembrane protease serine 9 [Solenopsis invicta]|uniref:transmembrane protease serine 9 n=1 Tax=Solenopsis invicta TaxID=13686 RepID=UPI00193CF6B2|nr:transmembrane protease serine 9 [Solenopsis invicta]